MHKKEQVIAPIVERELGLQLIIPDQFNTDVYGTFTNEIERVGDQLQAARKKLEKAMEQTGLTIGLASEGSFGPHPTVPFLPFNRELVLFIDKEQDIEITGYIANSNTNFQHKEVSSYEEALQFATAIGFPQHGVILKAHEQACEPIIKGIQREADLKASLTQLLAHSQTVFMETDMRAMCNPTRMKNIELATLDLVTKLKALCPKCATPGFTVTEVKKGLPCEYCGFPTSLPLSHFFECQKCHYQDEKKYPNGKEYADPSRCSFCNP